MQAHTHTHIHTHKALLRGLLDVWKKKVQSELRKSWQLWITLQTQEYNKAVDVKVSLFTPRTKPMLFN